VGIIQKGGAIMLKETYQVYAGSKLLAEAKSVGELIKKTGRQLSIVKLKVTKTTVGASDTIMVEEV